MKEYQDFGPWSVSPDGKTIFSNDPQFEATLVLSGDFVDVDSRLGYALELAGRLGDHYQDVPELRQCYSRDGLEQFVKKHFPDIKLVHGANA
ncbi:MAG: hypothetical protein BV459_00185 [Thermoplasmata archaeon M11B2D]|nr:MAG: hypothetical protein BV459_00185 [Thermoplasmata archaeon M11B2D]